MAVFTATSNQTAYLLIFILLGYTLSRSRHFPEDAPSVLAKLENYIFIPALVLGTFIENFTVEKLSITWQLLLGSFLLALIMIGISVLCAHICSKDRYERNIFTYGLCFSNFGFMGNAIVSAIFPDIFLEYLIFTLPLWVLIYLWGVPVLLMNSNTLKLTMAQRTKRLLNPMFVCMLLGMTIGLLEIPVPNFISSAVSAAGSCMSPIAMLLTGMTVAKYNLREILRIKSVYLVTMLRLIVFPVLFLLAMLVCPIPATFAVCAVCSLSMPLGLNTIIIPGANGQDTKVASGMAVVSHIVSCVTIPLIFILLQYAQK